MRGKDIGQPLEPECADLGEHWSLTGHRLAHDHIERADPIAGDDEQAVGVDFVDLSDLTLAEERQGQPALNQRR
jgi:hypothetical protein